MESAGEQPAGLRRFRGEGWTLLVLGVLFSGLAFCFPPSGDDWAWGSAEGVERLEDLFRDYNGRYAGNLAVLVLTRTWPLTPFVVGATLAAIVLLVVVVARARTPLGYATATALLLAMPLGQWRQGIAWLSGFSNYAIGGLFALAAVASLTVIRRPERRRVRPGRLVALFVLVVLGQLFIEPVALFVLLASAVTVGVQLVRRRRPEATALVWLAGAFVGALVMFGNSRYRAVAAGTSTYQGLGPPPSQADGVWGVLRQATGPVSQLAIVDGLVLLVVLLGVVAALTLSSPERAGTAWTLAAPVTLTFAVGLAAAIRALVPAGAEYGRLTSWSWLVGVGVLAALLLTAVRLVTCAERRRLLLVFTGSAVVLIAPMTAIRPYGPRSFLPSYLFLVAIVVLLLDELASRYAERALGLLGTVAAAVAAMGLFAGYVAVYATVHHAADERVQQVRAAVRDGAHRVVVGPLPFGEYVHAGDPLPGGWAERYKAYYHLPADLEIVLQSAP